MQQAYIHDVCIQRCFGMTVENQNANHKEQEEVYDTVGLAILSAQLEGMLHTLMTHHEMGMTDLDGKLYDPFMWDIRDLHGKVMERQKEIGGWLKKQQ